VRGVRGADVITPENERVAAMEEAGWPDVVWHRRDDTLRAFVRVSDADKRLRGAVVSAYEQGFAEGVQAATDRARGAVMPEDWMERAHDHPAGQ
jgi:hypothetical protein